ncbi:methylated-DNA--[protein]-cysteine S-methyltransferase [Streptococcus parasanguinis]|uniref:methylated-DNA--[protein]-cysteine S-methyltransferase n=1 Tax=Streptococcus parasanguinis TaxID=1318 RepID=UPI00066CDB94|nr:methylated-DNA--[protein]-cysteine S-methyltransferase [Streptococcus parasanguinis]
MTLYLKQFYESPMGLLSIIVSKEGLVELDFYDPKEDAPDPFGALEQFHPYHEKVKEWLDHYFAGDPIPISFPLAPKGTAFQERVWQLLREIPYGETKTYGQLAQDLSCGSAQAVGQAVGRNPLTILVPCHRVMGKNGELTGYASGLDHKRWLLQHEGITWKEK